MQALGGNEDGRMNRQKEKVLKTTLNHSYQDVTIKLSDDRRFRALLNPSKLDDDEDIKILSIPYKGLNLNTQKEELVGLHSGDSFLWEQTNTNWLIFLEHLEEDAYYRAKTLKCLYSIEIDNKTYFYSIRQTVSQNFGWSFREQIAINDMNNKVLLYIKKDDTTIDFFKRFATVDLDILGKKLRWQVIGSNKFFGDGVLEVCLQEHYSDPVLEVQEPTTTGQILAGIQGKDEIALFEQVSFAIEGYSGGEWFIEIGGNRQTLGNDDSVTFAIKDKRVKNVVVGYRLSNNEEITKTIKIVSI